MKPGETVYATTLQKRSDEELARGFVNYKANKGKLFVVTVWGVEDRMESSTTQILPFDEMLKQNWFPMTMIEKTLGVKALAKLQKAKKEHLAARERKKAKKK